MQTGDPYPPHSPDAELQNLLDALRAGSAHVHFITGRLAESALRHTLREIEHQVPLRYSVQILPISVAALMTPEWIAARLSVPDETTHVVLPGYCGQRLDAVRQQCHCPVIAGPRDLRDLPFWMTGRQDTPALEEYSIEILAEINDAKRLPEEALLAQAAALAEAGADVIDLGCTPGDPWGGIGDAVRRLIDLGCRVSVDSFDAQEVAAATRAGAELVLSVNSSNRAAASDWGCEVVAIPDHPSDWRSLEETVETLSRQQVPFRIDPILEPIGLGFAASLQRYLGARRQWPTAALMMGIGNLSELTDVDSAGVNMLLIGFCQELAIGSVLTTQVINWSRTAVAECNWARRIAFHAVRHGIPAKRISDRLVILRDARLVSFGVTELNAMAEQMRDHNLRVFAENERLHVLAGGRRWEATDPFSLFDTLQDELARPLDASHAFYLGYELAKAELALLLGKQYVQDEALDWGCLTRAEPDRHRLRRRKDAT